MNSYTSSRLNLSSPIYQSPIRASKRTDVLRLPPGLNASSFKNEVVLSQRAYMHFDNDENQYTQRKICCPNCRYMFNLAIDEKILDVLTKEKNTQTEYGPYEFQRERVEERINEETQQTAKELGMKVKSVLLMEKLIDLSKSRIPKADHYHQQEVEEPLHEESRAKKHIPYQQIKQKQIQVLLRYASEYLKEDVPLYIKLMFEDKLLWGDHQNHHQSHKEKGRVSSRVN